jgi:hypothetical protein
LPKRLLLTQLSRWRIIVMCSVLHQPSSFHYIHLYIVQGRLGANRGENSGQRSLWITLVIWSNFLKTMRPIPAMAQRPSESKEEIKP